MKTVLIVDDEFALVDTMKDLIEAAGYHVETANDGKEALALMKANIPHLVITDLMMPDMGGKEMLAAMRTDPALTAVPAILMSAARKQVAAPTGAEFPAFSLFLRKPFSLQPLMAAIQQLIGPPS